MTTYGMDRQVAMYAPGAQAAEGLPVAFEEWEARAREVLTEGPFGYVAGGAGAEDTMRANREAFDRWRLWPRLLRDVSSRDLAVSLLGMPLPVPFLLGPVGVQSIAHPLAERAPARVARQAGIPFVLSTVASTSIEEIAAEMGDALRWFQLYPSVDREISASLVARAEAAGYSALVVTVDTTMLGWRERDLRSAYLPFLQGQGLANYLSDPVFRARLAEPPEANPAAAIARFLAVYANPGFTWAGLDDIRRRTSLPLLLKGITHPADAELALQHGVDALIVSNHGGRQVDGAMATLDVLPAICDVIQGRIPVLMDSGIRRGADVLKALALGASAVLLGRPYIYGLAVAGEEGVREVISNLTAELDLQMALCGVRSVQEIDRSLVERVA